MSEFTADQIEDTFHACLKAGDVPGVETCLRAMVGADSNRAIRLYDDAQFVLRLHGLVYKP